MQQEQSKARMHAAMQLFDMATGYMKTGTIVAAAKLGIVDILASGPKSCQEIADAAGTNLKTTQRLLQTLTSMSILEQTDEQYANAFMAEFLMDQHPLSMRPYLLLCGDLSWWLPWNDLTDSITTGESAFVKRFGLEYDDYLKAHPQLADIFNHCMTNTAHINNAPIVEQYDFSSYQTIIDIGGNHGSLMLEILARYPKANGIVYDLPHIIATHKHTQDGTGARCQWLGGDMFQSIPFNGDLYILKQIIHDWDDERAIQILRNCHAAMHEHAKLLVIESVLDQPNASPVNYLFDLHMLVTASGGRERRESEFKSILQTAGFTITRTQTTPVSFCILEAKK